MLASVTYVFHGRTPNDWVSNVHRYTALFVVAPNDSQRSQFATVVERLLARGPVESARAAMNRVACEPCLLSSCADRTVTIHSTAITGSPARRVPV